MTTRQLPSAVVTDQVLKNELDRFGIPYEKVDFTQDYGGRRTPAEIQRLGGRGPYSKFYTLQDSVGDILKGTRFMVSSALPMANRQGDLLIPEWKARPSEFIQDTNLFYASIKGLDVTLTVLDDQPNGIKANDQVTYHPQIFLNGVEIHPTNKRPTLLTIDPINSGMGDNVLEWDYGICKRWLRLVQGRIKGYWAFSTDPGGNVLIRYNQSGDFRLKLSSRWATGIDTEFIPAAYFANPKAKPWWDSYPLMINDSLTVYPDEGVNSVDGYAEFVDAGVDHTWAVTHDHLGTGADTTLDYGFLQVSSSGTTDRWDQLIRDGLLFDVSGLGAGASVSACTETEYGAYTNDGLSATPSVNIYAFTPDVDTVIDSDDFIHTKWGATAFCDTPITYGNYNSGTPGNPNNYVFNATGLAAIDVTGMLKTGRRWTFDAGDVAPDNWSANTYTRLICWLVEKGTDHRPKVVITYTPAAAGIGAKSIQLNSLGIPNKYGGRIG